MKRNQMLWILPVFSAVILSCSKKSKPEDPEKQEKKLSIASFDPARGPAGTIVTINGDNFSANKADNRVSFGGIAAVVTDASSQRLTVTVPDLANTGKIKVEVGAGMAETAADFIVDPLPPGIVDFTPKTGPFGTEVTLTGRALPLSPEVKINGVEVQLITSNSTEVKFRIPYHTGLTAHKITIEAGGQVLESPDVFTVTAPGPYADWISKPVNNTPNVAVFKGGTSFVFNNKIYWGFRSLAAGASTDDPFYMVYDPARAADGWQVFDCPGTIAPPGLEYATSVVYGGKVYLGTGLPDSHSRMWFEFDPVTNTAIPRADFPVPMSFGVSFVLNNILYAGFGLANKNLYSYDPAGNGSWNLAVTATWRQMDGGSVFVLGNEAIIGRPLMQPGGVRNAVFRFKAPGNLVRLDDIPEEMPVLNQPAFTYNGKGYFVVDSRVWEYSPDNTGGNGTWRMVLGGPDAIPIQYVAVVNNTVYGWTQRGAMYEFVFMNW